MTVSEESLRDYVEHNEKLLTIFGVFAGLSAVFLELHHPYLTLVSYAFPILLLMEVFRYPSKNEKIRHSLRCELFRFGLLVIVLGLASHILQGSLAFALTHLGIVSVGALFVTIYVGLSCIGTIIEERTGLLKRVSSRISSKPLRTIVGIAIAGTVLMAMFLFSQYLVQLFGK